MVRPGTRLSDSERLTCGPASWIVARSTDSMAAGASKLRCSAREADTTTLSSVCAASGATASVPTARANTFFFNCVAPRFLLVAIASYASYGLAPHHHAPGQFAHDDIPSFRLAARVDHRHRAGAAIGHVEL